MTAAAPAADDRREFAALYAAQRERALAIATRRLRDTAMAEDTVSEVFAKALQRWDRSVIRQPEHYLGKAVTNETHSQARRAARERDRVAAAGAALPRVTSTASEAPFDRVADREVLVEALRRLPPRQRTAVLLRHLADLSEAETAQRMRVTVGTVKSSTARGLARLRVILEAPSAASAGEQAHDPDGGAGAERASSRAA